MISGVDGIARSAAFIGGTVAGDYSVAVTSNNFSGDNAALCGSGFTYARSIQISQGFGSAALPAASPWALVVLFLGISGIALVMRRAEFAPKSP